MRTTWPAVALLAFASVGQGNAMAQQVRWEEEPDKSLTLLIGGKPLWQFHYGADARKPHFHPVCLPDGRTLTWLRPPDHRWHRALWFSWKILNGLNYWEENKQGLSQGRTTVAKAAIERTDDGRATIVLDIDYHPPGKPPILKERRTLSCLPPDAEGRYRIDWHMTFTAQDADVLLDRTKTKAEGGPAWGGYAGLSFRAAKGMTAYQVLDSEGRRDMKAHGQRAKWMDFTGVVDGKPAGVAMFGHPDNPRHPSPWYVIMRGHFGYFSPALLFEEPYKLEAGQSFTLRYRVLLHPGRADARMLAAEYEAFSKTE